MRQMTMMWKRKTEQLLNGKGAAELLRYAVVGGLAFLVDFGVLVFCRERIFGNGEAGIYMSTPSGPLLQPSTTSHPSMLSQSTRFEFTV